MARMAWEETSYRIIDNDGVNIHHHLSNGYDAEGLALLGGNRWIFNYAVMHDQNPERCEVRHATLQATDAKAS